MSRISLSIPYHTSCLRLLMVLLAVAALPLGCAKVQPEPFAHFENSTGQASALVAAIAKQDTANLRKMDIARSAENPEFTLAHIRLSLSGRFNLIFKDVTSQAKDVEKDLASYEATRIADTGRPEKKKFSGPGYLKGREAERALAGLNASFAAYVRALSRLSSGKEDWMNELTAAKAGFEHFLSNASKYIPELENPEAASNVSQLLAKAAQAFVEYKQRRSLIEVLDAWQPVVDKYAAMCQTLLTYSSKIYFREYEVTADILSEKFNIIQPPRTPGTFNDKQISQRSALIGEMFDVNDKLMVEFAGIEALYQYYGVVPAAHDALGRNLKRNIIESTSLDTLIAYVKNIFDAYKALTTKQQPASSPSTGQKAAS